MIVVIGCIYLFLFFPYQMGSTVCYPSDNNVQVTPLTIRSSHSQTLFRVYCSTMSFITISQCFICCHSFFLFLFCSGADSFLETCPCHQRSCGFWWRKYWGCSPNWICRRSHHWFISCCFYLQRCNNTLTFRKRWSSLALSGRDLNVCLALCLLGL